MKKVTSVEDQTVTFTDENETAQVFELSKCSDAIILNLALHGAKQKIGDNYAGAVKATEGTEISPNEYSVMQVASSIEQLYAGDFNVQRSGTGPGTTDLALALAEATGETVENWAAALAESDTEEKKGYRAHPAVKAILDRFRAERAAKKAAQSAAIESEVALPSL